MDRVPLSLLAAAVLASLALPATVADLAPPLPADACDADVACLPAEPPASGDLQQPPCRPYDPNSSLLVREYCTVQGSTRAVAMFADNATVGNYTTPHELRAGVVLLLERIEACQQSPGNRSCPTRLLDPFG